MTVLIGVQIVVQIVVAWLWYRAGRSAAERQLAPELRDAALYRAQLRLMRRLMHTSQARRNAEWS